MQHYTFIQYPCNALISKEIIFEYEGMCSELGVLCSNGRLKEVLGILQKMIIPVETHVYASVLQGCANIKALAQGKQVHAHIIITGGGAQRISCLGTKLVNMYGKCGNLRDARQAFDELPNPNVFSWNSLILGHAMHSCYEETLGIYYEMHRAGVKPDNFTFPSVLKACAGLDALQHGKDIHDMIIRCGLESNMFVASSLIDMYSKCNNVELARQVFDRISQRNVVSWTAMIAGYTQNGYDKEALLLLSQMLSAGVKPNLVTVASVLPACARLGTLQQGKELHGRIIRSESESNVFVGNALIDMYTKCSNTSFARLMFDRISQKNVISWTAMIAGYAQNGHANKALRLFHEMQLQGVKPNPITMTCILPACAYLAALQQGKEIHNCIIRNGFESDVFVGSALIDMYSKCGKLQVAKIVFDRMPTTNLVSWNALILGHGMHGDGENATKFFDQMEQVGMKPDDITFLALLTAYSHAGLVDRGLQCFDHMKLKYHIIPRSEHYTCVVDLLGRAGRLDEAHDFITRMPLKPAANVWGALLGACKNHHNIELGESVAARLFEMEPGNPGYYVLMSNIYADAGRWYDVRRLRTMMKDKDLKKNPGCSWIEVKNKVNTFFVGDKSHPQYERIHEMLQTLAGQMKEEGYAPQVRFVLHDVDEEEKGYILSHHSEKLAIAFGLLTSFPGTPIQVTKNLRVCGDCHSAIKIISKIVKREIIVRDASRFHHFKDAICSCGGYW